MNMIDEPFEPRNELERQLIAAQEGNIPDDEFMQALLAAQLFMPVHKQFDDIKGFATPEQARPLTLETEEGGHVLVLFTSPERAVHFVKDHPGFEGGLLADFDWILKRVGSGYGVALNPGWSVGIDMDPGMVDQIAGRHV